jgi:hypothetical protein
MHGKEVDPNERKGEIVERTVRHGEKKTLGLLPSASRQTCLSWKREQKKTGEKLTLFCHLIA